MYNSIQVSSVEDKSTTILNYLYYTVISKAKGKL